MAEPISCWQDFVFLDDNDGPAALGNGRDYRLDSQRETYAYTFSKCWLVQALIQSCFIRVKSRPQRSAGPRLDSDHFRNYARISGYAQSIKSPCQPQ